MSVEKRLETDIFFKNSGLNRSLRVKNRKKRVYDQVVSKFLSLLVRIIAF